MSKSVLTTPAVLPEIRWCPTCGWRTYDTYMSCPECGAGMEPPVYPDGSPMEETADGAVINNYESWPELELLLEIARRKLSHGVNDRSFPDPGARRARLAYILRENDRWSAREEAPLGNL